MYEAILLKKIMDDIKKIRQKANDDESLALKKLEIEIDHILPKEGWVNLNRYSVNENGEITRIDLSDLGLKSIPKSLSLFNNLHTLVLSGNEISIVSNHIVKLESLVELNLSNNKLRKFPICLTKIIGLYDLKLAHNQIQIIPYEIKNLINLKYIDLKNNNIEVFPSVLLEMESLQDINLCDNRIEILPSVIVKYKNGICWKDNIFSDGIFLENNPLSSPPITIVKKKKKAIIEYFSKNPSTYGEKEMQPTETGLKKNILKTGKKIFISYSHKDEEYKEMLQEHLSPLIKNKSIVIWSDDKLLPGQNWDDEIKIALEQSDIILFLVSSSFMNSGYIDRVEIKKAIERHKKNEVTIVPIIVRQCDWISLEHITKFQVLPKNAKPIKSWEDMDEAFTFIVQQIKKII